MTREEFKAQLIFDYIKGFGAYPNQEALSAISELANFVFGEG